jgi:hypothetical protein
LRGCTETWDKEKGIAAVSEDGQRTEARKIMGEKLLRFRMIEKSQKHTVNVTELGQEQSRTVFRT